jgi:hypothetical protein
MSRAISDITTGGNDEVSFTWSITNDLLVLTELVSQDAWVIRLLAETNDQLSVSVISPDDFGGVKQVPDTLLYGIN